MDHYYLDDNRKAVPCSFEEWLSRGTMDEESKRVAASGEKEKVWVSTVFLGLDHKFGDGPPMLFETMIFGGEHDQYQERCSTWEEAEAMHKQACELAGVPLLGGDGPT